MDICYIKITPDFLTENVEWCPKKEKLYTDVNQAHMALRNTMVPFIFCGTKEQVDAIRYFAMLVRERRQHEI